MVDTRYRLLKAMLISSATMGAKASVPHTKRLCAGAAWYITFFAALRVS